MTTANLDERAWWVFKLPNAQAYVPASSEAAARDKLRRMCYDKAPVHEWPLMLTRVCSREWLVRSL